MQHHLTTASAPYHQLRLRVPSHSQCRLGGVMKLSKSRAGVGSQLKGCLPVRRIRSGCLQEAAEAVASAVAVASSRWDAPVMDYLPYLGIHASLVFSSCLSIASTGRCRAYSGVPGTRGGSTGAPLPAGHAAALRCSSAVLLPWALSSLRLAVTIVALACLARGQSAQAAPPTEESLWSTWVGPQTSQRAESVRLLSVRLRVQSAECKFGTQPYCLKSMMMVAGAPAPGAQMGADVDQRAQFM